MQVGIEAGGAPHQEDLGDLEMIAKGVAVGHRTRRDHGRAQQSGHQQDRDDPAGHRSPPPGILAAVEDHPTQLAERPQRRDDAQLHPDGQQDGQPDPVEPPELAEPEHAEGHQAQAHRQRQRRGVERVLGRLAESVEDAAARPHADHRQERREAQVDHGSRPLPSGNGSRRVVSQHGHAELR